MVSLIKADPLEEIQYLILSPTLLKVKHIYLREDERRGTCFLPLFGYNLYLGIGVKKIYCYDLGFRVSFEQNYHLTLSHLVGNACLFIPLKHHCML